MEVLEEENVILLQGVGYTLEVNRHTGLLENLRAGDDLLLKSGPYLNFRVPGKKLQYSTVAMDDVAENWKCTEFRFELNQGIATIHSKGTYNKVLVSYTMQVDVQGIIQIDYAVEHNIKDNMVQEMGLRFITGDDFETLAWDRKSYFTSYPKGALGAEKGTVNLSIKPEMEYRTEPLHNWGMDTRGFFYFGLQEKLEYTNIARALKEQVYTYSLSTEKHSGVTVYSNGSLACRFDRIDGENTLIVNDKWDYNSLLWGNYMKKIPLENEFQGLVTLAIIK